MTRRRTLVTYVIAGVASLIVNSFLLAYVTSHPDESFRSVTKPLAVFAVSVSGSFVIGVLGGSLTGSYKERKRTKENHEEI